MFWSMCFFPSPHQGVHSVWGKIVVSLHQNQSKQSCVFVVISDTNEQEKICMASTSRFCSSGKKKVQSSPLCIFITVHNMYNACTRARVCGLRTYCVQFKTRAEARVWPFCCLYTTHLLKSAVSLFLRSLPHTATRYFMMTFGYMDSAHTATAYTRSYLFFIFLAHYSSGWQQGMTHSQI